jgi:hypothetical protein
MEMRKATIAKSVEGNVSIFEIDGVMVLEDHNRIARAHQTEIGATYDAFLVDYRRCQTAFDPLDSIKAFAEVVDELMFSPRPVAILVKEVDLRKFEPFIDQISAHRSVRRAFTDRFEALEWASRKGRVWRQTIQRLRGLG